jgi:tRNA(adenine34) deaminase
MSTTTGWDDLEPAWQQAFQLAWDSWRAGSLGFGAVIVDENRAVVAEGRNRVVEDRGSGGHVAGTLLAHAEIDALAGLGLRVAHGLTVLSTVEPCLVCTSAAIAMHVEAIEYAAVDPVLEGMDPGLRGIPFCDNRIPSRAGPLPAPLDAFAALLPMAHKALWRPEAPPRPEWLQVAGHLWVLAQDVCATGELPGLGREEPDVGSVIATLADRLPASPGRA